MGAALVLPCCDGCCTVRTLATLVHSALPLSVGEGEQFRRLITG